MAAITLEQARIFATDSGISFNADNLVEAVRAYNLRDGKMIIANPQKYFIPILKEFCNRHEGDTKPIEYRTGTGVPGITRHYPFTTKSGVTWHSCDYATRNGRWYKKHLDENQHGGFDVVMRPCEKPHFPGPEETEINLQNDKDDGVYQVEAQKFFDLAEKLTKKLPSLSHPEPIPETIPWEKS